MGPPQVSLLLVRGGGLALLAATAAAQVALAPCTGAPSQTWALNVSGAPTRLAVGTECLGVASCAPAKLDDVRVAPCGSAPLCPGGLEALWAYGADGTLSSAAAPDLCMTLQVDGPAVNLWPCAGAAANAQWTFTPGPSGGGGPLTTRDAAAGGGCLTRVPGPGAIAILNASEAGGMLYGVGGLAAIGGARLIYEYPEAVRAQILDLLFLPSGGTAFQVLKTELEGDVDSSYGSGPSFQHSRGEATSFRRGIYLPWLLGEAKARNSAIGTYALAWGMPGWVGANDTERYLGPESLAYHMAYFAGVRATYNWTFDLVGVHNERAWSRGWVKALRAALDADGFGGVRISVSDASNSGCTDCTSGKDTSITTAAAVDADFAAALDVIGLHSTPLLPRAPWDWVAANVSYIQSENNDVDGPLIPTADGTPPQWAPVAGDPIGAGLGWVQRFLLNYVNLRIVGTVICPLSHAWTWGYGRHNHGTALFIRPWDGNYVLGAAFWTQAHFTQAARPGWRFLDGSGSGAWSGAPGRGSDWFSYVTLVSPDATAFSIVAVNGDANASAPFSGRLVGSLADAFAGTTLAVWTSDVGALFVRSPTDLPIGADGAFAYTLPPRSIATLTTLRTLSHMEPAVPPRAPFPLPYANDFEAQRLEEPGRMLSDLFGAFYVTTDPLGARGRVLRQAVPANPGANSWLDSSKGEGLPFTSLPAPGAALANGNISAAVLITAADVRAGGSGGAAAVSVCGRVPIWQPAAWRSNSTFLGVCLNLFAAGHWTVTDTTLLGGGTLTLASGPLPGGSAPPVGAWHTLSLAFDDAAVTAAVDGTVVAALPTGVRAGAGVYGLGSRWHGAHFDDVVLAAAAGHPPTPASWLFDVLPGEALRSNFTGWAGFVLDMRALGTRPLAVSALGRFRARGNAGSHALDVLSAATGRSVLPGGPVTVDMRAATTDVLGFAYAALPGGAVTLAPGARYFVVSREQAGGDAFVAMADAAAATTHVHRDGTTLMSYAGPGAGVVSGKVSRADGASAWVEEGDIECAYGPLNLLVE